MNFGDVCVGLALPAHPPGTPLRRVDIGLRVAWAIGPGHARLDRAAPERIASPSP